MIIVVAAALIDAKSRILIQKRPAIGAHPGLWEFPGGKLERGETLQAALTRELKEELGIDVDAAHLNEFAFSTVSNGNNQLLLLLYLCEQWAGNPEPLHALELHWARACEFRDFEMPAADMPLAAQLVKFMT